MSYAVLCGALRRVPRSVSVPLSHRAARRLPDRPTTCPRLLMPWAKPEPRSTIAYSGAVAASATTTPLPLLLSSPANSDIRAQNLFVVSMSSAFPLAIHHHVSFPSTVAFRYGFDLDGVGANANPHQQR